ncbi:MAG: BMP family ABC transporter substrate-binding protein [Clostridia bacterium]|nr:BMP family ABC transporter substrate-binding protein [Clostridia bacterium]
MKKFLALTLVVIMALAAFAGCQKKKEEADDPTAPILAEDGTAEIAFITDVGQLMDKSFNQGTWEGCRQYAKENGKTVNYYQPANGEKATDADRYKAMEAAINNGAKIVVCAGFMQANALTDAAKAYPDTKFVFIDGWPLTDGDGGPVLANVAPIAYKEEQAGYFAGYAVVMEGYTKLGFCGGGGGTNPACCRYGYGFVQGAEAAAAVKNVDVQINYSWQYGESFSASPDLQTMASGWYENGTEIIFACGGSMFSSITAAASANEKKVVGVDVDQSNESNTVVTSAMKGLAASVKWAIDKFYANKWADIGGVPTSLGVNDDAVGLPTETWSLTNWSVDDYKALFNQIKDGSVVVDPNYPEDMATYTGDHVTVTVI